MRQRLHSVTLSALEHLQLRLQSRRKLGNCKVLQDPQWHLQFLQNLVQLLLQHLQSHLQLLQDLDNLVRSQDLQLLQDQYLRSRTFQRRGRLQKDWCNLGDRASLKRL